MKKSIIKNISLGIACLLGVGGAITAASIFNVDKPFEVAQADDNVQFIYRYWNEAKKEVSSMQGNIDTYTPVTSTTTSWTGDNGGYYVVNSNVSISSRVTVTGTVNLILCDGAELTAEKGISVLYGTTVGENTLNIYGQTNDTGKLISTATIVREAAIGGNDGKNSGTINIFGGDITANCSKGSAAGIGGGGFARLGRFSIFGGKVDASCPDIYGAGIGGGCSSHSSTITSEISIYGGTIVATGGKGAAGIGGGLNDASGIITINGGNITATGGVSVDLDSGSAGAGIGSGGNAYSDNCDSNVGDITINGGNITATGASEGNAGAGIGLGGNATKCGSIIINGGNITATGGTGSNSKDAAGIGSGAGKTCPTVNINGGTVTATGGNVGANGIGAGTGGTIGTLTVNNGLDVLGNNEHEPTTSDIQTDYSTNRWRYMVVKILHAHNISYDADGATITATCSTPECPLTETQRTLTLALESSENYYVYDGTSKGVTFVPGYSTESDVFGTPTITYSASECVNAGNYTASVTYGGKTASLNFSISKASSSLDSNPTGVAGLIYTGNAQELITAGTASGGELKYSLDGTNYSSTIPTGTNAGDYTVYYKVFGDSNHNDSEEQNLVVSISKATVDPVGTLNSTYGKTLGDVILPSGWAWDDPTSTSVGNAGSNEFNATFAEQPNYNEAHQTVTINVATVDPDPVGVLNATYGDTLADVTLPAGWAWDDPTSTSVGNAGNHSFNATYTPIDGNHHAKNDSITVNVSQAIPTGYDIPTGLEATYGDSLSSVALPSTWSWKNPNDKIGNAGNREHIAIYTPIDPNYKAVENILTVAVSKANPSVPTLDTIEAPYDVALSTVDLPEGFSWMDGNQKVNKWGENTYKAKYTPTDTDNYNVIENIDIKVNAKWILVDPTASDVSVTINDDNEEFTVDISVKVEVKTEVTIDEKRNEYASLATKDFVKPNEDISAIYGVKLIRTTNGVEEEIQPSDIKPGTKITVSMAIPEELVGKEFRLLHIHNADDIVEITNYAVSKDGKTLTLEVDRLSDFAFITATDKDNGFIYSIGLPGWALALIIVGGILLLGILALLILFIFFPVYYIDYSKKEVRRAIYMRTKDEMVLMINARCQKVRRNEADVYEKKSDALKALNK